MPAVVLDGYLSYGSRPGHVGFAATGVEATASKTRINNLKVALNGDKFATHSAGKVTHLKANRPGISGSTKTIIENKAPLRKDDLIGCGDACAQGSVDTFIE